MFSIREQRSPTRRSQHRLATPIVRRKHGIYTSGSLDPTDIRVFLKCLDLRNKPSTQLVNVTFLRPNGAVVNLDFAENGSPYLVTSANLAHLSRFSCREDG